MYKLLILLILCVYIVIVMKKCYKYNKRNSLLDVRMSDLGGIKMAGLETVNIDVKADIGDVADWFLLKENMSNKKIQKLCYYAEAWSLAKLDIDIAKNSKFEAWVHGPVNIDLYKRFKSFGWRSLKIIENDVEMVQDRIASLFCKEQIALLDAVWDTYGCLSADELEALTHKEMPWLEQRDGLGRFENSRNEISSETMKKYYRSIALE